MLTTRTPIDPERWRTALEADRRLRTAVPMLRRPELADWEDGHRLVLDTGVPWVFGPLEIDPLLDSRGRMPLPDDVATELRLLSEAGASFDRIVVAHELDPEGPASRVLGDVPAWGLSIPGGEARRLVTRPTASERSRTGSDALDRRIRRVRHGVRRVAEGTALAAALPLALPLALLDPIVFGVNGIGEPPRAGQPAVFYPLAAWRW